MLHNGTFFCIALTNVYCTYLQCLHHDIDNLVLDYNKSNNSHVYGFFDNDLHEVSWHFATHEDVMPSGL